MVKVKVSKGGAGVAEMELPAVPSVGDLVSVDIHDEATGLTRHEGWPVEWVLFTNETEPLVKVRDPKADDGAGEREADRVRAFMQSLANEGLMVALQKTVPGWLRDHAELRAARSVEQSLLGIGPSWQRQLVNDVLRELWGVALDDQDEASAVKSSQLEDARRRLVDVVRAQREDVERLSASVREHENQVIGVCAAMLEAGFIGADYEPELWAEQVKRVIGLAAERDALEESVNNAARVIGAGLAAHSIAAKGSLAEEAQRVVECWAGAVRHLDLARTGLLEKDREIDRLREQNRKQKVDGLRWVHLAEVLSDEGLLGERPVFETVRGIVRGHADLSVEVKRAAAILVEAGVTDDDGPVFLAESVARLRDIARTRGGLLDRAREKLNAAWEAVERDDDSCSLAQEIRRIVAERDDAKRAVSAAVQQIDHADIVGEATPYALAPMIDALVGMARGRVAADAETTRLRALIAEAAEKAMARLTPRPVGDQQFVDVPAARQSVLDLARAAGVPISQAATVAGGAERPAKAGPEKLMDFFHGLNEEAWGSVSSEVSSGVRAVVMSHATLDEVRAFLGTLPPLSFGVADLRGQWVGSVMTKKGLRSFTAGSEEAALRRAALEVLRARVRGTWWAEGELG